jgi:hypothetical protein
MLEHRLREFFAKDTAVVAAPAPAFVPCPMFLAIPSAQLSFVAEVYRLAREMAEAQLRKPARPWPPAFSLN